MTCTRRRQCTPHQVFELTAYGSELFLAMSLNLHITSLEGHIPTELGHSLECKRRGMRPGALSGEHEAGLFVSRCRGWHVGHKRPARNSHGAPTSTMANGEGSDVR